MLTFLLVATIANAQNGVDLEVEEVGDSWDFGGASEVQPTPIEENTETSSDASSLTQARIVRVVFNDVARCEAYTAFRVHVRREEELLRQQAELQQMSSASEPMTELLTSSLEAVAREIEQVALEKEAALQAFSELEAQIRESWNDREDRWLKMNGAPHSDENRTLTDEVCEEVRRNVEVQWSSEASDSSAFAD